MNLFSSSFGSSSSPFALLDNYPSSSSVSKDDFILFHHIDCRLFITLIQIIHINLADALQVMAFLIYLERCFVQKKSIVQQVLEWPLDVIHELANQVTELLRFLESERLLSIKNISLIQKVSNNNRHITLPTLYAHRIIILQGISKMMNQVCLRAFEDLLSPSSSRSSHYGVIHRPIVSVPVPIGPVSEFERNFMQETMTFPQQQRKTLNFQPQPWHESLGISQCELTQILSGMNLGDDDPARDQISDVPPDERTIFLTFSKGYPITVSELRDFFTRLYGNFIEAIYMQEVQNGEQPLYAKMVVKPGSRVAEIVGVNSRAKFVINGKHVWARKFVRKNRASPVNSLQGEGASTSTDDLESLGFVDF